MDDLRAQLLDVFRHGVIVYAVQNEVVLEPSHAVHVDSAGAAGRGAAALLGVAISSHAGDQLQQVVPVPPTQGNIKHHAVIDHRPRRRLLGFE